MWVRIPHISDTLYGIGWNKVASLPKQSKRPWSMVRRPPRRAPSRCRPSVVLRGALVRRASTTGSPAVKVSNAHVCVSSGQIFEGS